MAQKPKLQTTQSTLADAQRDVRFLLDAGKCKQAVEMAKDWNKKSPSQESEALLVEAYAARIREFQAKGAPQDAQTLLSLVRQRFPNFKDHFGDDEIALQAQNGQWSQLLSQLGGGQLSPKTQVMIETAIRRHATDPRPIADCAALAPDHSLRGAASAIWQAFAAVTTGPVTAEQMALPQVARKSPLADWKWLIRGIGSWYQGDVDDCRRAAKSIAADSAVFSGAAMLLALCDEASCKGPRCSALMDRIHGGPKALKDEITAFENVLAGSSSTALRRVTHALLMSCGRQFPSASEELRLWLEGRMVTEDVPESIVRSVLGAPRSDAARWRMVARTAHSRGLYSLAFYWWTRFHKQALQEQLFAPGSLEEAAVLECRASALSEYYIYVQEEEDGGEFTYLDDCLCVDGQEQPHDFLPTDWKAAQSHIADLWHQTCAIAPDALNFAKWMGWAIAIKSFPHKIEACEAWAKAMPDDVRPLLQLCLLAEERKAHPTALKYLAAAELVDAFNPQVRQTRLRLTWKVIEGHFKAGKAHLVLNDIETLREIPPMKQATYQPILLALEAAYHRLAGRPQEADAMERSVREILRPLTAHALIYSVRHLARQKMPASVSLPKGSVLEVDKAVLETLLQARHWYEETQLHMHISPAWLDRLRNMNVELSKSLSTSDLLRVCNFMVRNHAMDAAYVFTGTGLARCIGAELGRFLILRGLAVGQWDLERKSKCLMAARMLLRQTHDSALAKDMDLLRNAESSHIERIIGMNQSECTDEQLRQIVELERATALRKKHLVAQPGVDDLFYETT